MSEAPEKKARETIDALLTACGWAVQNYVAVDFTASRGIALREVPLKSGRCDYLLLVDRQPVGIVEAKRVGTTLSAVAEQSANYGDNLPGFLNASHAALPFYYESTGVETFFRDARDPDPRSRQVFAFHRPETLLGWRAEPETLRARLAALPVAHPLATAGMRDCQIEAITNLETSFADIAASQALGSGDWRAEPVGRGTLHFATPAQKALNRAGRPFVQLVLEAMSANRLTAVDAARYLGLRFEHFDELREQLFDASISPGRDVY